MSRKDRLSSLEELVFDLVKNSPSQVFEIETIQHILRLESKKDQIRLNKCINRLVSKRLVSRNGKTITMFKEEQRAGNKDRGLIEGKIQITPRGTGFVIVENMDDDIRISNRDLGLALADDVVKVKVTGTNKRSGQPQGKVIEIVERGKQFYVGTLKKVSEKSFLIETDHKSVHVNFFVLPDFLNGAKDNDKVTFKLASWVHQRALPEAQVLSVLGEAGSNDAKVLSILAENDLQADFPKEVIEYANAIPDQIPEEEFKRRRDLRQEIVFTIDPVDAKDFDDALSIEVLDNGNFYLGVHIADVTHYLRQATVLDDEGHKRATSIYLVDRVIPMLPERLSNGLCSLRPHEDKLTYSCFMEIDKEGQLVNYSIEETAIHSKQRFTYEEAQEILEGKDHPLKKEVHAAGKLAKILMDKRFREGAIDFDSPEPRFRLDEQGKPIDVVLKQRIFAHRLIEECMLMANRTVASHVKTLRDRSGKRRTKNLFPFFYRIHDKPDQDKLSAVAEQVKPIGIQFELGDSVSPKKINKLLQQVKGTSVEVIVNELMLRSMAKAVYGPDNLGHFGLGFANYAHFTSPIRRYPDVIVHRLLKAYATDSPSYKYEQLKEEGEHCSERERVAVDAERDSIKLKQVEFLSDHIGETYDGIISGVTERGIFVTLKDIYCEGMIRVADLKGDYFNYDKRSHSLVGRRSGQVFTLGSEIQVTVESTNLQKRQIDFILA
ncbi:MAG: ribonuclease R [Bacteroidota bacterium]